MRDKLNIPLDFKQTVLAAPGTPPERKKSHSRDYSEQHDPQCE
jgi:hypothetical protein